LFPKREKSASKRCSRFGFQISDFISSDLHRAGGLSGARAGVFSLKFERAFVARLQKFRRCAMNIKTDEIIRRTNSSPPSSRASTSSRVTNLVLEIRKN
jgi:hypothetical protein